jgi:tight adherence protein C
MPSAMLAGAAATGIGIFLVVLSLGLAPRRTAADTPLQERLTYYGVRAPTSAEDEIQGSLFDRFGRPQLERLLHLVARSTPSGHYERVGRHLGLAGNPFGLSASDFVAVRGVLSLVGVGLGIAIGLLAGSIAVAVAATVLGGILGWLGADFWLRSAVRQRREVIRMALPDTIDFMVVAMQAGMTFDIALARVVEKFKNPLTAELARAQMEVDLGRSRQEALEAFARRSEIDELSAFVQTVVTAGQMGVPLVDSLRVQADDLRWRRRDRARVKGAQAPIRMTIPMVLFIFPTLWIILLGPSLLTIMRHGL